jgi:hypothetical protein
MSSYEERTITALERIADALEAPEKLREAQGRLMSEFWSSQDMEPSPKEQCEHPLSALRPTEQLGHLTCDKCGWRLNDPWEQEAIDAADDAS